MNIKSLILARGGSKAIPKKNMFILNGKPLIWYSIKAAQGSLADDVWVSSDDVEILELAKACGAKTIVRPDHMCQDNSKSEEALLHFADNVDFDALVFIQPTSPMILSEDIDGGLSLMSIYDSVFSAYKEHWVPKWNMNGTPLDWSTFSRPMRQERPELWVENGAFYITRRASLLESGLRYSGKIGIFEMPTIRSFQIDTYSDLKIIEKLIDKAGISS